MADHERVIVYVRAEDARLLKSKGQEPAKWVRELVKRALEMSREEK